MLDGSDSTINNSNAGGTNANDTNNGSSNSGAADATKNTDTNAGASGVDTSKFTQADWEEVYKNPKLYEHPRFKGLNDRAQLAKRLEDEKTEAEKTRLVEEKKFQELADVNKKEAETWKARAETASIDNSIAFEALKLGVADAEAVTKLIDRTNIKLGEDGSVTGVAEAVKALVEAKPYLKTGKPNVEIGLGTNPSESDNTTPRFKLSQLQDFKFWQDHNKNGEIDQALKLGLVQNDIGAAVKS